MLMIGQHTSANTHTNTCSPRQLLVSSIGHIDSEVEFGLANFLLTQGNASIDANPLIPSTTHHTTLYYHIITRHCDMVLVWLPVGETN